MAAPAVSSDRTYPSHFSSHEFDKGDSRADKVPVPGGLIWLPPVAVLAAYVAFHEGVIAWPGYRVWWACVEVHARREIARRQGCALAPVSAAHVIDALGRDAPMPGVDVERNLEDLHLIVLGVLTKANIHFPDAIDMIQNADVRAGVASWAGELGQRLESRVGIPRRLVTAWRQQARGFPIPMGVAVGLVFRVLMSGRYPDYRGHVKARWLERFSGGSGRSVQRAIASLVSEGGVFERLDVTQRELQRYGIRFRLKIEEKGKGERCGTSDELSSLPVENPVRCRPSVEKPVAPDTRVKRNQKHAYTASNHGACQHDSGLNSDNGHRRTSEGKENTTRQRVRSLSRITRATLRDPEALQGLFEVAVEQSYARLEDRPVIFALACHALRVGRDPAALFYQGVVKNPAIRGYVSGADEDAAAALLAELGEPTAAEWSKVKAAAAGGADTDDVQFVLRIMQGAMGEGVGVDEMFALLQADGKGRALLEDWGRERWEAAVNEAEAGEEVLDFGAILSLRHEPAENRGGGELPDAVSSEATEPVGGVREPEATEEERMAFRREVVGSRRSPAGPRRRSAIFSILARQHFVAACEEDGVIGGAAALEVFVRAWELEYGPAPPHYPWEWGVEWTEQAGESRVAVAGG